MATKAIIPVPSDNITSESIVDNEKQQLVYNKEEEQEQQQRLPITKKLCTNLKTKSSITENNCLKHEDEISEPTNVCKQLNLSFCFINYTTRAGLFYRERKQILNNVSGQFLAGELTAIIGPSGAGKSTLIDILSGYRFFNVTGKININGVNKSYNSVRLDSCYIMQDDNLQPLLTVDETFHIAANLRLPKHFTSIERKNKIEETIISLRLQECRHTQTRNLSGGQKKRLAIALELMRNPSIMFFDEPISGLDSSVSKQCLTLLKSLAREGRTIVCSIHQPSAILLEMFDHLYIMSEGYCVYQGCVKGLISYLNQFNLHCPTYHNPADFVIEVCQGQHGDNKLSQLVDKSENGRNNEWRRQPYFNSSNDNSVKPSEKLASVEDIMLIQTPTDTRILPYATSFLSQFIILLKRTIIILSRDRFLTYSRFFIHVVISLCIGFLYYKIGTDARYMLDNCNFLFLSIMFLGFTAFSSMTLTFPLEIPIISREYFNRWYSLKSYYLAVTIADMPVQILSTVVFVMITFYMTAQPFEVFRFGLYLLICIITSLVSQSVGVLCGALMNITYASVFGPFFICPFLIFSGFFLHFNDAQPWVRWLFHTSFLKYGFEGLMLSIFGYDRPNMPCSTDYCHFRSPTKFLNEITMPNAKYNHAIMFLITFYFILRTVTYLVLLYRLQYNR